MKLFIDKLKGDLEPIKPRPDWVSSDVKLPNTHRITVESDDPRIKELEHVHIHREGCSCCI